MMTCFLSLLVYESKSFFKKRGREREERERERERKRRKIREQDK